MALPYVCIRCSSRAASRAAGVVKKQGVAHASTHHSFVEEVASDQSARRTPTTGRYSGRSRLDSRPAAVDAPDQIPPHLQPEELMSFLDPKQRTQGGRYSGPSATNVPPHSQNIDKQYSGPRRKPWNAAVELEKLLETGQTQEAWSLFLKRFGSKSSLASSMPSFQDMALGERNVLSSRLSDKLLMQLCRKRLQPLKDGSDATSTPSPQEVLDKYEESGLATREMRGQVMWTLAAALEVAISKGEDVFDASPLAVQTLDLLMKLWAESIRPGSSDSSAEAKGVSSPWHFIPADPKSAFERRIDAPKSLSAFFHRFISPFGTGIKGADTSLGTAMLTYDILTYGAVTSNGLSDHFDQYQPFVDSLKRILVEATIDGSGAYRLQRRMKEEGLNGKDASAILDRLGQQPLQSAGKKGISLGESKDSLKDKSDAIVARIGRAIEHTNVDFLDAILKDSTDFIQSAEAKESNPAVLKVYEHFLMAYLGLRRPQAALEMWNIMVKSGCQPTVRTWTVMMKGCQPGRDWKLMENFWNRMRDSGLQPDGHAWSVRIYGLFRYAMPREGLRALDEMGKEWVTAARTQAKGKSDVASLGDVNGIPRPGIFFLNSAVTAIASQASRSSQVISQVLTWGRNFSITPDITTYNSLINCSLSEQSHDEATKLLQQMSASGIEPNSETPTIFLNSLLRTTFLSELSHAEQQERILSFISSLESDGLTVDGKGYALVIDRLIKDFSNINGAQAILAHMKERHIEPTPHIYTILMTYYFSLDPPALDAADALWRQIQAKNNMYGVHMDVIFFDRMIEGYARHGDVGRMMAFLTRMGKEGKRPGWPAMMAVIQCLVGSGQMDRAREVAIDCRRGQGLLQAGLRGTKGQVQFWNMVYDLGVLESETELE